MDSRSPYVPVPGARHRIEFRDGREWIVVKARRNWFALPFLAVWLTFWTVGGVIAMTALFAGAGFDRAFLIVWLVGWAFGWAYAAGTILWQLTGRTMVSVGGGALTHAWRMLFIEREKQYRLSEVRNLRPGDTAGLFGWSRQMGEMPPFMPRNTSGSVRFDYGARTVHLFPGLDEAEGRMIAVRLARLSPHHD
jgi:hypothetical protein